MKREPVISSNIQSVGYDAEKQVLEVEFKSGGVYRYVGVNAETHEGLMRAASTGGYFAKHIRGKYALEVDLD